MAQKLCQQAWYRWHKSSAKVAGVPEKILSKRTVRGEVYVLVKWKDFDKPEETTYQSIKGFPELIKEFRARTRK